MCDIMNNQFDDDEAEKFKSLQGYDDPKDEMIDALKDIVRQYQQIVEDQSSQISLLTSLLKIYSKTNKDN